MSGRNRGPSIPTKGGARGGPHHLPMYEPPFARGSHGQHPPVREDMREAHYSLSGSRQRPPHPAAIIEERLAVQHDDIQALLVDNQRLAATHVALRQELEAVQYELQRADNYGRTLHSEKDAKARELYEKSVKLENELLAANAMRSELMKVNMDIKELTAARQDLTTQVQMMTHDLGRVTSDLQQIPAIKSEIEGLKQELEQTRVATEHEKKAFSESFEHGKMMEGKLVTMAREMEKLRAELANAGKRAHVAKPDLNPGLNYNVNYGNPDPGNPYIGYGMTPTNSIHPVPAGAEGYPQYGPGAGAWGSYMQRTQGPR
ncbi:protein FLX-like 1 isoform X2 [Andrographis paniculata]|uniref:protein FLX-like 1 isoform X2 n=1 Tax=Andrographis paniculata TaxID=175694 RepID=UPI0021E83ABC|nr:protein FLX-like 1 isoform X2 [Andrographis paniculata]